MNKTLIIALNGEPVAFTPEQITKLNTGEADPVWSVFEEVSRKSYHLKKSFPDNDLKTNGYKFIDKALSPAEVAGLKRIWNEKFKPISIGRSEEYLQPVSGKIQDEYSVKLFSVPDECKSYVEVILGKVLNNQNVNLLEDYFGSHFSVNHVLFSVTSPDEDPITSFRWHKDAGPEKQTHIMVFLSDSHETGGRIEFINYEDSAKIENSTYYELGLKGRVHSILEIVPDANIYAPMPAEGDAVIFNATNIYHCGKHPTQGVRYVMNIILQPDLVPWKEALKNSNVLKHPIGKVLKKENPFYPYFMEVPTPN